MYAFDLVVALGSSQTGLTLTASVRDTAGTALGSQPAYTVVEHGGGWYSYHTSAMPDGQRGVVRLLSGATVMAVGVVTPIETENAAVKLTGDPYPVVAHASYGNAQLVRSTVPANTLDVSATGEAGVDWANVGGPTTTVNLSNTTVGTATTLTNKTGFALTQAFPANFAALAIAATTGQVGLNFDDIKQASGATTLTNITVPAVTTTTTATNLTNLPTMPTDWLTAAGLKADAVTKIMAGLPEGPDLTDFATAVRDVDNTTPAASSVGAAINSRMATFTYTAPPTAADNLAAWKADAEVITLLASGAALDLMIVDDGAGAYEFTAGALANAPTGGTAPTVAQIRTEMDANSTKLAAIVADTNELQADWADGGRLDLLLDAAAAGGGAGEVTPESIGAALDAYTIEAGLGLRGAICSILATTTGVGPGLVEGVATWKDPSGAATRVAGTVTAAGRTTVTLTPYEP